ILVINNIDKYVTNDDAHTDLSSVFVKYFHDKRIQVIAIATPFMFQKYIEPHEELKSIFTEIKIQEMPKDKAEEVLLETCHLFELRHQVTIPYESIIAVVDKSDSFIAGVPFPEKALKLLEDVCISTTQVLKQTVVLPATVDKVLTEQTHTPTSLSDNLRDRLLHLEEQLKQTIVHQSEALSQLSAALQRSFVLLGKRKKPLASFLFLGPTGVGKTETAKAIVRSFFNSENNLVRFDMSAYQSTTDIPKLIGDANNPGQLTEALREKPYGVLLLDEIEKANKDLLNIFLTILDEGYFTDGWGKRVDCRSLIVIATSNAGAQYIHDLIVKKEVANSQQMSTQLTEYLIANHVFNPEFLNRFDGIIAYEPLMQDSILQVARNMCATIATDILSLHGVKLQVTDETLQKIIATEYNPAYGARNMDRAIRNHIETELARLILEKKVSAGQTVVL
ncbi:ATP-dependent Clp protease ATP-binding subunit, partial [Candidatus Roizmanbacteria bacterium]|nr:ATP-dependent Clp protease ATP-binding subunit [Candidatus Roizmanbacteria bacterium]